VISPEASRPDLSGTAGALDIFLNQAGGKCLQIGDGYPWTAVEITHLHSPRIDQRVQLGRADVQIPSSLAYRQERRRRERAEVELRLGLRLCRHSGTGVPASQPRRRYRCPLCLNRCQACNAPRCYSERSLRGWASIALGTANAHVANRANGVKSKSA
jgi:hypothetical protein